MPKRIQLNEISHALARSIDMSALSSNLLEAGIDTEISEMRVSPEGEVYVGGGENETAFEATFTLHLSELTIGWADWTFPRD